MILLKSRKLLFITLVLSGCLSSADNGLVAYQAAQKRSEKWVNAYEIRYNQPNKYMRLDFGRTYISKVPLHVIWRNHGEILPCKTVDVIRPWHKSPADIIPAGTFFRLVRWENYDGQLYVRFENTDQDYPIDFDGIAGYVDSSIAELVVGGVR